MTTVGRQHVSRIARAGSLNVVGAGVSAVAGLGVTLVLTNGLSVAGAGTVFATTSAFLIAVALVQLGAESGMARLLPLLTATGRRLDVRSAALAGLLPTLAVSFLLAALVAALAPTVAGVLVADASRAGTVTAQVRVLAGFLPAAALLNVMLAATRGLGTIKATVLVESLGRSFLQLAAVTAATLLSGSPTAFALAWAGPYVIALAWAAAWLFTLLRRTLRPVHPDSDEPTAPMSRTRNVVGEFWSYTGPRAVATVAQSALKRSDIVLVAALRSPEEAALYAAASRFVALGQIGVQAVQQALAPQLSRLFALGRSHEADDVYKVTATWAIAAAWPVYLVCALLAPLLLQIFGPGYDEAAPVVVVLSLAMLLAVACGSVDTVVLMSGRSWLSLSNTLIALGVNLILNLLLIPPFGILGAAVAWAVALVVRNGLPLWQIRRHLGLSPFGPETPRVAAAAVGLVGLLPGAVLAIGAGWSVVIAALAVGLAGYAGLMYRWRKELHLSELIRSLARPGARRRRGIGTSPSEDG